MLRGSTDIKRVRSGSPRPLRAFEFPEPRDYEVPRSGAIAFLFVVYDSLIAAKTWESFFGSASTSQYRIFVHARNRDKVKDPLLVAGLLSAADHVETSWGGLGYIRCVHNLLRRAFEDRTVSHAVLLCGATVPLLPFDEIYRRITRYGTAFQWEPMHDRFYKRFRDASVLGITADSKSKIDAQGIVWARREALKFLDAEESWVPRFQDVQLVDEHYWPLVARELGFRDRIPDVRMMRMTFGTPPYGNADIYDVTEDLVRDLRAHGYLWLRKVDAKSKVDTEAILVPIAAAATDT